MSIHVSLKNIAREAGVSVATVSLALRNNPKVKKATRERVRATAKAMGYTPHPLLASLASKKFRDASSVANLPISFLTYLPQRHRYSYSYLGSYMEAAQPRAAELGYRLEHFELGEQKSYSAFSRMLYRRGFSGIILGPVRECEELPDLPWDQFSVVACGGVEPQLAQRFHWVKTDFFGVTRQAYRRAWEAGFRKIAVILADQTGRLEESDLRVGAVRTIGRRLHPEREAPVFSYVFEDWGKDRASLKKSFLQWFYREKPEIVIGYSIEFYYALLDEGIRIPEEVRYISLHINPKDKWYNPLAGYQISQYKLGRTAVEILDAEIHFGLRGYAEEPRSILLVPDWVDGSSFPGNHS